MKKHTGLIALFVSISVLIIVNLASANVYLNDVYFTVPDTVYMNSERIELKGFVYQSNYSNNGTIVSSSAPLANAAVNITIKSSNGTYVNNFTFTTDSLGSFYSKNNFYTNATEINASTIAGTYYIRAEYKNLNNNITFSQVEINVVNQSVDTIKVSPEKSTYNPSETLIVKIEATRLVGDNILLVSNVSVNGSLRNSSKSSLQTFNCTTASNGKCSASLTAPSTYGDYTLEINNFKAFSSLSVVPFLSNLYMKDDLGKSLKNVFALGEQGTVEVKINNASSSDIYTFSGYIADSSGNSVKSITSTTLNSNNSFTNTFLFTVDALTFGYGTYSAHVTIIKSGDGNISAITSFEIGDWTLAVNKRTANSGLEYGYSAFQNQTMRFEALPTYRANGTVINGINSTSFAINLKDNLNTVVASSNASWNASCGKSGCYEFNVTSPLNAGEYFLVTALSYGGASQTETKKINVISGVLSAQSTDKDGNLKELFGTNDYVYFSLSSYNSTSSAFNLSDAEIFLVSYMNGSEFSYTQLNNFTVVNSTNSVYEWAWNSTLQRIKVDVPKSGGIYNVLLFGNNRTLGTSSKFIVNPYDACIVAKDTPGTVSSGNYYVWQFKTSDTIYFEIKLTQANNPLGKANALNSTNSSTYGMGAACSIDTTTKQVITNATLTVSEVKNLESGAMQNINSTDSVCQASDTTGGYSCTVKPSSKWDGGTSIIKFTVKGQDGTTSDIFSRFEARSFYLYGSSQIWQNSPTDNITLNLRMYEAGGSWWSTYGGSGGISGTVTIKRVEYQGRDGEWIWPPVDSGYNVSNLNSSTITGGSSSISLPVTSMPGSVWKTGNYRVVMQATTSSGDTDYGYAWFGIKLWDVYGQPIDCTSSGCNYKNYFNSKENITMYIKISKAGDYSYSYQGGQDIWGNTTVSVKKIENCKTYPCKALNSSQYTADTIKVNGSSPWYWNANINNQSKYLIRINTTTGTWGTGYYNVVLDVNGTDTGYAWFNTLAFYVSPQPTNVSGSGYKYSIRGTQQMYFNVTVINSYKWGTSGLSYNSSDFVNATLDSAVLRMWDQQTYSSKEYNYPADINITPTNVSGNVLLNVTFLNGTWPTGYYSGELTLKNAQNETSSGYLWFSVQPFRAQINTIGNTYNYDSDQCANASTTIYDADWSANTPLAGNYSVISVYENVWGVNGNTFINYSNYTAGSFNATVNKTFCPNNGQWSSGSWGGYHYLNVLVKDNVLNDTQTGWLSFRTVPFQVNWGAGGTKSTNQNVIVSASLTKPSTGANTTGNLTKLYQWRYDNYKSTREEYIFKVGNCYSNVSGQCTVNGTTNITIYAPSGGWRVGYNYIQGEWTKDTDSSVSVQDWSGIYFEGREAYNGYFDNTDIDNRYKYSFAINENITIKVTVRNSSYNAISTTITNVQYSSPSETCGGEYCRSYTDATFAPTTTNSNGYAILDIKVPSSNWSKGYYYIKAAISGSAGTATITGGNVRVKDTTAPNITITTPTINATYNWIVPFAVTTPKDAQCNVGVENYNLFSNWNCGDWNSTNATSYTKIACNTTKYNFNGSTYYTEYVSNNYRTTYDGVNSTYTYATTITTGGKSHTYTFNTTNWTNQDYGINIGCYDADYNYASAVMAFKVNKTT